MTDRPHPETPPVLSDEPSTSSRISAENQALAKNFDSKHLKEILAKMPGFIYWKNKDSIYMGCNQNLATVSGLSSAEDMIGKTDYDFYWGSGQAESFRLDDQHVMESGHSHVSEYQMPITRPDGRPTYVRTEKIPLRMGEQIDGILAVALDITEQKITEEALVEAKQKAEIANQAKSHFLASMSHELRTPLNAMLGMAQVLQAKTEDDQSKACLDVIYQSGTNLLALINDILDFAKLEAGKLAIHNGVVNLKALCEEVLRTLSHLVGSKNIELRLRYQETAPIYLEADPKRLRQILINLLGNAIKFTDDGFIKIDVRYDAPSFTISVQDTGIGIPKERVPEVFGRFSQIDNNYNRHYEGTGLGLAICKQLVDAMGGSIHAESELGRGSRFWINLNAPILSEAEAELKISEEDQTAFSEITTTPATATRGVASVDKRVFDQTISRESEDVAALKPKLLLVEDNELNQCVAKIMLEDIGCDLDIVYDAEAALRKLKYARYDLIFTDLGLPGVDGLTFTRTVREQIVSHKKIPIIAMTAHVLDEDRDHCLAAGANAVVTKPILREQLITVLRSFLPNHLTQSMPEN